MKTRRILVADDNADNQVQLQKLLSSDSLQVDIVGDGEAALEALIDNNYSIIITDLTLPKLSGMHLIEEVQQRQLPVTVLVLTEFGSVSEAVKAMQLGANDFLIKPIDPDHIRLLVNRALKARTLQDEVVYLREQLNERFAFHNIISKNPRMLQIFELIGNVAPTTTTVLIEGETGTGKEQVAQAIHLASQSVRSGPLVAVNCAALPENLLESELFGHEKGAFTSAVSTRRGRFEMADSGTIFLDEVGDIPMSMQAKLLRVLQERQFERVGGTETLTVDVRVVAATNRSLLKLVKRKRFREDLYYRINVVKIDLPPLRDRPEDIPLLATHFATKYARSNQSPKSLAPQTMDALLEYRWPGNIRELENAIERASVTCHGDQITPEDLPPEILQKSFNGQSSFAVDLNIPLPKILAETCAEIEKDYLNKALQKSHGNVGRAARICGLSRRSISSKISAYQINKMAFKEAD